MHNYRDIMRIFRELTRNFNIKIVFQSGTTSIVKNNEGKTNFMRGGFRFKYNKDVHM